MKPSLYLILTLMASACSAGAGTPPPGFTPLWNGRDLAGWWGAKTEDPRAYMEMPPGEFEKKRGISLADIHQHWRLENGELVNDGKGLFLTTDNYYGDFELLADYKTVPLADSGIYLRGCPQVQIWDHTQQSKFKLGSNKGSGGLWNNRPGAPGKDPLVMADKPFGEWNHLRILMAGSKVWVWLNGQPTVTGAALENYFDRNSPPPPRGPIQLQTHGAEIRWRDIFIREIGGGEANTILRDPDPSGFRPVFNGRDFEGWSGALENYEIRDGAIVCKAGKGGAIYTGEEFANFAVRLEFKLPPAGNNGLAIRYPGKGNPAYDGMCELQVLDSGHPKYAKLDPRQFHGSAYGMVAARRGFLRPPGEWNFEEVTVMGSTVKVELNGTVILEADLAGIAEFHGKKAHPGKDLARGHFGFCGHNDPVMFRHISIRPLN